MTSTGYETIEVRREGRASLVTLDRPEQLNVLDPLMRDELVDVAGEATRDGSNVLVLRGSGRMFCAGVDLDTHYFPDAVGESPFTAMESLDEQHGLVQTIHDLPMVTIAAVNGDAIGGAGFGMAMACDLRYAVRDARFWLVAGSFDVTQDYGLSWLLQRQIGMSRTMEMAFTGRRVDAITGEAWGFINGVFDDQDALDEQVRQVATGIAEMAPEAARLMKHVVRAGATSTLSDQLKLEAIANGLCFQSKGFLTARSALRARLGKEET